MSPVSLVVALVVAFSMGRPILFRQQRLGYQGRTITVTKFRTMTYLTDGSVDLAPSAERITPTGKFLRSTGLDELPQLVSIVRGDLSFVGPRPLLVEYGNLYDKEQARRHDVRPGLTGWAQVHGRSGLDWEERFRRDVWYVDNRSFWLDLRILVMTVGAVARGTTRSDDSTSIATRFKGPRESTKEGVDRC